jgi:hypothetical protein
MITKPIHPMGQYTQFKTLLQELGLTIEVTGRRAGQLEQP